MLPGLFRIHTVAGVAGNVDTLARITGQDAPATGSSSFQAILF